MNLQNIKIANHLRFLVIGAKLAGSCDKMRTIWSRA